jgi:hypothetical protein
MFCFDVGVNGINVCLIYIGSREAYVDENYYGTHPKRMASNMLMCLVYLIVLSRD